MAHLIEKADRVFSVRGTEWHGKATHIPEASLDASHLGDIMFRTVALDNLQGTVDGELIPLTSFQAVAADLRYRGAGIVPLGMHTDGYKIIENSRIWQAVKDSLKDHEHVITTAGTLDGCKRFFVSAQLSADGAGFEVNGERFNAYLNFISSHDGSLACQAYDSMTRIVCNNTLQYSMADAKHRVYIRHTSGAEPALVGASEWIAAALAGRVRFASAYDQAMNTAVRKDQAFQAVLGWYWNKVKRPEKVSTRTRNTIDSIFQLFESGRGNHGDTFADLLNGVTEYYTSGDGTGVTRQGKPVSAIDKQISADFGAASDVKSEFARLILTDKGREELTEHVTLGASGDAMDAYRNGRADSGRPVYMSGLDRTRAVNGTYGQRTVAPIVPPLTTGSDDFASLLSAPLDARN